MDFKGNFYSFYIQACSLTFSCLSQRKTQVSTRSHFFHRKERRQLHWQGFSGDHNMIYLWVHFHQVLPSTVLIFGLDRGQSLLMHLKFRKIKLENSICDTFPPPQVNNAFVKCFGTIIMKPPITEDQSYFQCLKTKLLAIYLLPTHTRIFFSINSCITFSKETSEEKKLSIAIDKIYFPFLL